MNGGDLSGRTAVVTGAARGIGAALAVRLAQRGAQVALVGLERAELEATTAACQAFSEARAWGADVTDLARMRNVAAEVVAHSQEWTSSSPMPASPSAGPSRSPTRTASTG